MDLTKEALKKMCRDSGLYTSPALNDKLYLHYKGIRQIQNLEEYTGLRVLWLEGNGLCKLEGMGAQTQMKTLYAHENLLEKIEGLDSFLELDTLNLSKNFIKRVENISHLGRLTTLLLANNHLETADDVREVLQCPSIQTLDLQHNRIDDPDVVGIVSAMHDLRVLYLQGNPVVKHIRHYRKTLVSKCANLKYLDDRPVFDEERRRCTAWSKGMAEGGISRAQEAEREEVAQIRESRRAAEERQYLAFEQMMREGLEARQRAKQQTEGGCGNRQEATPDGPNNGSSKESSTESTPYAVSPLPPPPPVQVATPAQSSLSSYKSVGSPTRAAPAVNEFSGEDIVPFDDCETVRNARQRRVTRILESSAPANSTPLADTNLPQGQQGTNGLPLEVEPLDESDLDVEQLSKGVDEEILALDAKCNRLRKEKILHNTPPQPPATIQPRVATKVGWNDGTETAARKDAAEAPETSAIGTNFEELD
eukprot:g18296.t1